MSSEDLETFKKNLEKDKNIFVRIRKRRSGHTVQIICDFKKTAGMYAFLVSRRVERVPRKNIRFMTEWIKRKRESYEGIRHD